MTNGNLSRRKLLGQGLQLSVGGVVLAAAAAAATKTAAAADAKVCVDMAHLPAEALSIRESLNYVEKSPDATKTCAGCGFFEAKGDGCGNCMIFTGPANANGHCDSWAAKG